MAIQKLGIRASCDHCGEQGVAATVKELGERLGWRVVTGKSQQTFCTMHCEQEWVSSQLSPTQTSLEDALNGAEQAASDLPPDPAPVPDAFRDMDDDDEDRSAEQ